MPPTKTWKADDFNLPGWAIVLVIALEMAALAAKAWIFEVVLGK